MSTRKPSFTQLLLLLLYTGPRNEHADQTRIETKPPGPTCRLMHVKNEFSYSRTLRFQDCLLGNRIMVITDEYSFLVSGYSLQMTFSKPHILLRVWALSKTGERLSRDILSVILSLWMESFSTDSFSSRHGLVVTE